MFIVSIIMTSTTLTLSGCGSTLVANYFPPIELDGRYQYECGFIDFHSFHSIPNIDSNTNSIHIGDEIIQLPTGTYEIESIHSYIRKNIDKSSEFNLSTNKNTLHCEISSSLNIDFTQPNSIAPLLGFSSRILSANTIHISDNPVNVFKVNIVRIDCDLISGSFFNNRRSHTLHEFFPLVAPGYKIVEAPRNVIYFPIVKNTIDSVTLSIIDQDNQPINFRNEQITIRIHIKRIGN